MVEERREKYLTQATDKLYHTKLLYKSLTNCITQSCFTGHWQT